ncbi:MAG: 6-phosphogluconolactonase [Bacteroidetes bacterium]|nr:6-phosphogluconolactonase [Bacteroidota bacterium]
MVYGLNREVRRFADLNELSASAAEDINRLIVRAVRLKSRFSLALSGGTTPRLLYRILGTTYRDKIPWKAVHFFWGDERYVPHDDKDSNYHMAKESLLEIIPVPVENVHPIPTTYAEPAEAAELYEKELRKFFDTTGDTFDLVLLGMGKEGHTASLFPESPALAETNRWALAVEVAANPPKRITLTYPVLNRADAVYFLISGQEKAEAIARVFDTSTYSHSCPAKGVNPSNGKVVWWIDSSIPDF